MKLALVLRLIYGYNMRVIGLALKKVIFFKKK
jgi:hypothetical protein